MSKLKATVLSLSVDPVSSAVSSVVGLFLILLLLIVLVLMVLVLIVTKGSIALLSSAVSSDVGLLLLLLLSIVIATALIDSIGIDGTAINSNLRQHSTSSQCCE